MEQHKTSSQKKRYQFPYQLFISLLIILTALSACSRRYSDLPVYWPFKFEEQPNRSVGRFKTSYLAQQIDNYYRGVNPGPIGVTTFVNLDELNSTSSFGRVCAEQLLSELSMRGYDVVELRHADALHFLNSTGEFGLSRDVSYVKRERDLGGLIVGTYVVSPVRVYLNARLIDPANSKVLSAGSVEMTKTEEITKLTRGGAVSPSLERIPVKKLGMYTYPMPLQANYGRYWDLEESGGMAGGGMMAPSMQPAPRPEASFQQLESETVHMNQNMEGN